MTEARDFVAVPGRAAKIRQEQTVGQQCVWIQAPLKKKHKFYHKSC
jgi:hypothetical protein